MGLPTQDLKEPVLLTFGLLATAHTINTLSLSNTIDQYFPALGSNFLVNFN
jgi:hypothetical protein